MRSFEHLLPLKVSITRHGLAMPAEASGLLLLSARQLSLHRGVSINVQNPFRVSLAQTPGDAGKTLLTVTVIQEDVRLAWSTELDPEAVSSEVEQGPAVELRLDACAFARVWTPLIGLAGCHDHEPIPDIILSKQQALVGQNLSNDAFEVTRDVNQLTICHKPIGGWSMAHVVYLLFLLSQIIVVMIAVFTDTWRLLFYIAAIPIVVTILGHADMNGERGGREDRTISLLHLYPMFADLNARAIVAVLNNFKRVVAPTTIMVDRQRLSIKNSSALKDFANNALPVAEVRQLYTTQTDSPVFGRRSHVIIMMRNDERIPLMRNLTNPAEAHLVERTIEEFLGIEDLPYDEATGLLVDPNDPLSPRRYHVVNQFE